MIATRNFHLYLELIMNKLWICYIVKSVIVMFKSRLAIVEVVAGVSRISIIIACG